MYKNVEDFISNEGSVARKWLITEILKNPELVQDERDLLDCFVPIIKKFVSEIDHKLEDSDFSKEELSEMYFKEATLKTNLSNQLKEKLNRNINESEKKLIDKIIEYLEELIIETWFKF
ncbi:MAG: hypothetical protein ACW981_01555 [Candidatus Hodarchaeales archaeon]